MHLLLRLLLIAGIAAAASGPLKLKLDYEFSWDDFKQRYGKQYSSCSEETGKQASFVKLAATIKAHNLEAARGLHNYSMGMNAYSDLSNDEIISIMNGYKLPNDTQRSGLPFPDFSDRALPASVDWRTQGYVTPVKDQGQCGSCWTFSSTGALEGQNYKATGKLTSLSEQNLLDCVYPRDGCQGGWMDDAFQYVVNQPGIDTEASYPYQGTMGSCLFKQSSVGGTSNGHVDVTSGSEAALQQAVANIGPVSVAIDASHPSFQSYRSGVYYEPACSSTSSDHAVLVVGYGTASGQDYWIVKNSWGTTWGESGYIRMARNRNNNCAIATYATYPTVGSSANTSCKTNGGYNCVFPFKYKGVSYSGCTKVEDTQYWCSVKNDANGNMMTGYWGYCQTGCPTSG